jgi:hypothetical protein
MLSMTHQAQVQEVYRPRRHGKRAFVVGFDSDVDMSQAI